MTEWAYILLTVFSSSCGDILCARGMSAEGEFREFGPGGMKTVLRKIVTRRLVIMGWICYAISFFALMGLLSVAALSVAVPATALSFVLDTIGARFILHEHVPWKRWAGVLCVTAGVVMVVQPVPSAPRPRAPALTRTARSYRAAMQSSQDQACHDQPGARDLDSKSAPRKVFAKP